MQVTTTGLLGLQEKTITSPSSLPPSTLQTWKLRWEWNHTIVVFFPPSNGHYHRRNRGWNWEILHRAPNKASSVLTCPAAAVPAPEASCQACSLLLPHEFHPCGQLFLGSWGAELILQLSSCVQNGLTQRCERAFLALSTHLSPKLCVCQ